MFVYLLLPIIFFKKNRSWCNTSCSSCAGAPNSISTITRLSAGIAPTAALISTCGGGTMRRFTKDSRRRCIGCKACAGDWLFHKKKLISWMLYYMIWMSRVYVKVFEYQRILKIHYGNSEKCSADSISNVQRVSLDNRIQPTSRVGNKSGWTNLLLFVECTVLCMLKLNIMSSLRPVLPPYRAEYMWTSPRCGWRTAPFIVADPSYCAVGGYKSAGAHMHWCCAVMARQHTLGTGMLLQPFS